MTDDKSIEEVSSFTYLGVVINKHLTWQVHIDYICNEINKKLFRCLNNLFTYSFDTVFNSEHHDYNTKSKDNVHKAFSNRNWDLWNSLARKILP